MIISNISKHLVLSLKNYLISRILENITVLNNANFQIYKYYEDKTLKKIVKSTLNSFIFYKKI